MTIHITPDNKLHDDADGFALTLQSWPKDARKATQEEIDAIQNPSAIQIIPTVVSMRQARLALLQFGVLSQVNLAIANGNDADKIAWEYATEVRRSDALVTNMATALGLNEASLDSLFSLAASL
jgi:hypothetical protein